LLELFNFAAKAAGRLFMTKAFALYIFIVCLLPVSIFGRIAEFAEFTVPHTYIASGGYSLHEARAAAIEEAQGDLLRQLGVLVEAQQRMVRRDVDGISQEDFIEEAKTYTLGRVQTNILPNTENFAMNSDGAMVFSATFRMLVDTADLFQHLNNILAQRQQARADSIALIERARADSIALIERVRADSIARAQRISELEQAVIITRRSLEQEQGNERRLRIERDRLERELQEAAEQRSSARQAFENARNAPTSHTDIGAQRTENERQLLNRASENYNRISAEFRTANENWQSATRRVEIAQNDFSIAENNLRQETGRTVADIPTPTTQTTRQTRSVWNELDAARAQQQRPEQRAFEDLDRRRTAGEFDARAELQNFADRHRPTAPPPAEAKTNNRLFLLSIRPEFTINNTVMSGGGILEFGLITQNGLYFSGEFNGGAELSNHLLYFSGLVNVGGAVNQNGVVKNALGVSAGYRNIQNSFCFRIDGRVYDTTTGDNISFGGVFWKFMFGRNHNFDITNRFLLGTKNNPVSFDVGNNRFIYESEFNATYLLSIGYTLTKSRR